MNELICTLIIIGGGLISIPIAWLLCAFGPRIINEIIESIKWHINKHKWH